MHAVIACVRSMYHENGNQWDYITSLEVLEIERNS